jgi:hypothetical protein
MKRKGVIGEEREGQHTTWRDVAHTTVTKVTCMSPVRRVELDQFRMKVKWYGVAGCHNEDIINALKNGVKHQRSNARKEELNAEA